MLSTHLPGFLLFCWVLTIGNLVQMGECHLIVGWALTFEHFSCSVEYSPLAILNQRVSGLKTLLSTHLPGFLLFCWVLTIGNLVQMGECHLKVGWALTFEHFSCSVEYSPLAILNQRVSGLKTLLSTHLQAFLLLCCSHATCSSNMYWNSCSPRTQDICWNVVFFAFEGLTIAVFWTELIKLIKQAWVWLHSLNLYMFL